MRVPRAAANTVQQAAPEESAGVAVIKRDRLGEISNRRPVDGLRRRIVVAPRSPVADVFGYADARPSAKQPGIVGNSLNSFVIVGSGAVVVTHHVADETSIAIGNAVAAIKEDRVVVFLNANKPRKIALAAGCLVVVGVGMVVLTAIL